MHYLSTAALLFSTVLLPSAFSASCWGNGDQTSDVGKALAWNIRGEICGSHWNENSQIETYRGPSTHDCGTDWLEEWSPLAYGGRCWGGKLVRRP